MIVLVFIEVAQPAVIFVSGTKPTEHVRMAHQRSERIIVLQLQEIAARRHQPNRSCFVQRPPNEASMRKPDCIETSLKLRNNPRVGHTDRDFIGCDFTIQFAWQTTHVVRCGVGLIGRLIGDLNLLVRNLDRSFQPLLG